MTQPSVEERKWLGRYLRKLIEKMGAERFLCAPILLPSPRYFPDRWNGEVADVHRLTQRLMHHAGLGDLGFTLSGFDDGSSEIFDSGTAGWYAGQLEGCCFFGVHADQLEDPEKAIGVMAHEVAHAFRDHHKLMRRDARDREELLTDLTTIYLGFGVFTTNNTDRYRSSGGYGYQEWSNSAAGYLPPPAMAWLLALQAAARGDRKEMDAIARELEPNQQAQFRDAIEEIENDSSWLEAMTLPAPRPQRWTYALIEVREPDEEEAFEVEEEEDDDPQRNAGVTVYRLRNGSIFERALFAIWPGAIAGVFASMLLFGAKDVPKMIATIIACMIAGGIWITAKTLHYVCSSADCETEVTKAMAVCPGCGGTLGRTINESQLRAVREEELERLASQEEFEECDECAPEEPCAKHA